MTSFRVLLSAIFLFVRQANAAAGTCSTPTPPGVLACDDSCTQVGTCQADGTWQLSQNCPSIGYVCWSGACVTSASIYCNSNYLINCPPGITTTIRFPSLVDCTSYYVCEPGEATASPSQCYGTAYDACTGSCTGSLQNGFCRSDFVETPCTRVGQTGLAPGNDAQYYRCVIDATPGLLRPSWFQCDPGYRYSLTAEACQWVGTSASIGCTVCAGAAAIPGPVAHAATVCRFVWCHARNNFEVRNCRSGWYYAQSEGGCVYGGSGGVVC